MEDDDRTDGQVDRWDGWIRGRWLPPGVGQDRHTTEALSILSQPPSNNVTPQYTVDCRLLALDIRAPENCHDCVRKSWSGGHGA